MRTGTRITMLFATLLLAGVSWSSSARALEQPDCDALGRWAAEHASTETITLAPEVQISSMFAHARTEPVFGARVTAWSRKDFNQVRRWLNQCRSAKRKDKAAADRYYKAYKLVSSAAIPVSKMEQFRQQSDRAVNNLVNYHRSDTLVKVLALAQQALQGADVTADVRALRVTGSVRQEVRTLQNAHDYLAPADVESLTARLEEGAGDVQQAMGKQNEEFEALKRELAEVPLTMEGARTLARLSRHPLLGKVSRDEALDFENAIMQKRRAIHVTVRQREARERAAAAATPVETEAVMQRLIRGDSVEDVSLRGVKPGIPYLYAKKFMSTRFSFKAATGGDLLKEFGPIGRDVRRYKQAERRDGGHFMLETMGKTVGKIKFTEHYTGPLDLVEARDWLVAHFGEADESKNLGNALAMTWHDDGMNLTVSPGNRTSLPFRNPREYKSSLVITLWSDDYEEYRLAAKKRCAELRNKPTSQLSVQDKMDIVKGCRN